MRNSKKTDLIVLFISIYLLLFFGFLVYSSYFNLHIGRLDIILEMITIPSILALLALVIFNFSKLYMQHWVLTTYATLSTFILILSVLLLVLATIKNV